MSSKGNNDIRWTRTEGTIRRAFMELLKEKTFTELTVSALIHRAKISRSAFYLHYQDKYALLEHYRELILAKLQQTIAEEFSHFQISQTNQELQEQFYNAFLTTLNVLYDDLPLARALFIHDNQFREGLGDFLNREIERRMALMHVHYTQSIPRRYAESILAGELLLLIQQWIDNPHPEGPEKFARILTASRFVAPIALLKPDQ